MFPELLPSCRSAQNPDDSRKAGVSGSAAAVCWCEGRFVFTVQAPRAIAMRGRPGRKQYSPPLVTTNRDNPFRRTASGTLRKTIRIRAAVRSRDGILRGASSEEAAIVHPLRLDELELPPEIGSDKRKHQSRAPRHRLQELHPEAAVHTRFHDGSSGGCEPHPPRPRRAGSSGECASRRVCDSRSRRLP